MFIAGGMRHFFFSLFEQVLVLELSVNVFCCCCFGHDLFVQRSEFNSGLEMVFIRCYLAD